MTAKKAASTAKHKTVTKKHVAAKKHTETAKQKAVRSAAAKKGAAGRKVTAKAKAAAHAKAGKAVSFAVGDWLPVCGFEAVAMSARLAGARIHDDDVGALWSRLGERPDGVPVGDAIAGAALFGLGGFRPLKAVLLSGELREFGVDLLNDLRGSASRPVAEFLVGVHDLILHVDVPGPHAVLATADGWWSWGELHDPWPCRVEEAWAVSWS